MNPAALLATSPRRAALLVHAMPRADQDWLLGSLAPHHRVELETLLDELRALGIPPDESLLRDVIDAPVPAAPADPLAPLERLAPHQVAQLAELSNQEPPQLVAALLATRDWPWRESLLQALEPARRQQVAAVRAPQAPALQQSVCAAVLRRLESAPARAIRTAPAPAWKKILPIRWKGMRP